jgi:hypothetical protein
MAETLGESITEPYWQATVSIHLARSAAEVGDGGRAHLLLSKAETATWAIGPPDTRARDLGDRPAGHPGPRPERVCGEVEPEKARYLLAWALRVGGWTIALPALGQAEPDMVRSLADEFLDDNFLAAP